MYAYVYIYTILYYACANVISADARHDIIWRKCKEIKHLCTLYVYICKAWLLNYFILTYNRKWGYNYNLWFAGEELNEELELEKVYHFIKDTKLAPELSFYLLFPALLDLIPYWGNTGITLETWIILSLFFLSISLNSSLFHCGFLEYFPLTSK